MREETPLTALLERPSLPLDAQTGHVAATTAAAAGSPARSAHAFPTDADPHVAPVAEASHDEAGTLGQSIEVLKEMAFNLLQEVKALGHSPATDVQRGVDFYDEVRRFEIDLIRRALAITDGHQSRAARLLNLKITTLNSMLKRYGIDPTPTLAAAAAIPAASLVAGEASEGSSPSSSSRVALTMQGAHEASAPIAPRVETLAEGSVVAAELHHRAA